MFQHVLLAVCLIGIPFVYAQENYEIVCEIPDPTGLCYKPVPYGNTTTQTGFTTEATVTGIGIVGGILILSVLVGIIIFAVLILFGKDISKFIKKQ